MLLEVLLFPVDFDEENVCGIFEEAFFDARLTLCSFSSANNTLEAANILPRHLSIFVHHFREDEPYSRVLITAILRKPTFIDLRQRESA